MRQRFAATPDRVFAAITDHAALGSWLPADVRLETPGTPPPNGLGAVRVVRVRGLSIREQVTRFEAPRAMDYRVISGAPFQDHLGQDPASRPTATAPWSITASASGGRGMRAARSWGGWWPGSSSARSRPVWNGSPRRCRRSTRRAHDARRASAMPRTRRAATEPTSDPGVFPIEPPIEPMLAKLADGLPEGDGWLFEPKWDGFRAIVFKDGDAALHPEPRPAPAGPLLPRARIAAFAARLPARCVVDGEIVIAGADGLDFDLLQLRLHPAGVARRQARRQHARLVRRVRPARARRSRPARRARFRRAARCSRTRSRSAAPPIHLTPITRDRALAADWFRRFEGAGLDGVIAKPARRLLRARQARDAEDQARAHRRLRRRRLPLAQGGRGIVGSLLLGLYDEDGALQHVGVTSSFTMARRRALADELAPAPHATRSRPTRGRSGRAPADEAQRMPGARSRWNAGKDLSWEPLRVERVCEVKYDHLQGRRFRHAATFLRWRPDKPPADCRYDQLEVTPAYELAAIFGADPRLR